MSAEDPPTELLFSYGTLQLEQVQLDTFGRRLKGARDALVGYQIKMVQIRDQNFTAKYGDAPQRNLQQTGEASDIVEGTVLELTKKELKQADAYEPAEYKRQLVQTKLGKSVWVYLSNSE